jgi:hypothetical protein
MEEGAEEEEGEGRLSIICHHRLLAWLQRLWFRAEVSCWRALVVVVSNPNGMGCGIVMERG